jgi:hypothetical protein
MIGTLAFRTAIPLALSIVKLYKRSNTNPERNRDQILLYQRQTMVRPKCPPRQSAPISSNGSRHAWRSRIKRPSTISSKNGATSSEDIQKPGTLCASQRSVFLSTAPHGERGSSLLRFQPQKTTTLFAMSCLVRADMSCSLGCWKSCVWRKSHWVCALGTTTEEKTSLCC